MEKAGTGNILFSGERADAPPTVPLQEYAYEVRSETNGRENNEDSFQIFSIASQFDQPPIVFLAIADGMGGHAYGEHASQETLRKVSLVLYESLQVDRAINQIGTLAPPNIEKLGEAIWGAVEQANNHLRRMVVANKWGKSGSTIILVALLNDTGVVVNLGDSPLFHFSAKTRALTRVTQDHTVAGVLLEAGMITPEMARYHEGRSRLEFHVGSETLPTRPPVHRVLLHPGDLLLLCSDGISGPLDQQQIADILAQPNANLKKMADDLIHASVAAGETDNQTLILWQHRPNAAVANPSADFHRTLDTVHLPPED